MNEEILFYAFRYALGRMTYSVLIVADEIIAKKDELSEGVKQLIIREIKEAEKEDGLGMEIDKEKWMEVVKYLEK